MDASQKNQEIFDRMPNTWHEGPIPEYDTRRRYRRLTWSVTAAAALLLPFALLGVRSLTRPPQPQQTALATYQVDKGVKGKVVLPDSTVIYLNSGSTVNVLSDFGKGDRRVYLDGEGWFEVKSDARHPFYVTTPTGVNIKVTGTRFNLSSYRDEPMRVLLESGRIELIEKNQAPLRILPDQQVTIARDVPEVSAAAPEQKHEATAWREGTLIFNDTPMEEAIARIERWYGVRVQVNAARLSGETLTGEFVTETISEVFNILSLTHGFKYSIQNKDIIIK